MFFGVRLMWRAARALLGLATLLAVFLMAQILYNSQQDQRETTDAIVVLGASQFDGTPSPVLANRLDHAAELLVARVAPMVVTVGGKLPGDRFTEAASGRQYLIAGGISPDRVRALGEGSDTWSSLQAVARLMKRQGWDKITVVSDPAHVTRAQQMSQSLGLQAWVSPTTSGPGSEMSVDYVVREWAGCINFWLVERWWG